MTDAAKNKALHFRNRLHERHGIHMTLSDLNAFIERMKGKQAAVQLNCRLGLHRVELGEVVVGVLYDRKHEVPITALRSDGHLVRLHGTRKAWMWDGEQFTKVKQRRGQC